MPSYPLPETLNHWRKKRGLSVNALARRAGIHRSTWHHWNTGRSRPSICELESVFHALDIPTASRIQCLQQLETPRALLLLRSEESALPMPLGDLLRALRLRAQFTQADAARKIGITQSLLGRWERGLALPSAERLHSLCYALGASVDEVAYLTLGSYREQPPLPDDIDELVESFRRLIHHDSWRQKDLSFLAYSARFLRLGREHPLTNELLAMVWGRQAYQIQWRWGRHEEAIHYGNAALSVFSPTRSVDGHTTATVVAIAQAWKAKSGLKVALEYLRLWQTRTMEKPGYGHWINATAARLLSDAGETETAIRLGATFFEEARHLADEEPGDFINRRWDYVHLLRQGGKAEIALTILENHPVFVEPHLDIFHCAQEWLALAETKAQVGQTNEAAQLLDKIQRAVRQHDLPYQARVNQLARHLGAV